MLGLKVDRAYRAPAAESATIVVFDESSGSPTFVVVVQATDFGDFDHPSATDFLDFAMLGAINLEREMRARAVIGVEVFAHNSRME